MICMKNKGAGIMNKKYNSFNIMIEVIKISPAKFFLGYFFSLCDAILLALVTIQMQKVFKLVTNVSEKGIFIDELSKSLLILLLIKIGDELSNTISNYIGEQYYHLYMQNFIERINIKVSNIEPVLYEDQKFLNLLDKALVGAREPRQVLNFIMDIFSLYIPYFFIIGWYLFSLKPTLIIVMFLVFIPVIISGYIKKHIHNNLEEKIAPIRRKKNTFSEYITKYEYIKETKSHNATLYFIKLFKHNLKEYNSLILSTKRKDIFVNSFANILVLIGYISIILILIHSVIKKDIGLDSFAAVFATINQLFSLMEELFTDRLAMCMEKYPKIKNYITFMNLDEQKTDAVKYKDIREIINIKLKDVSFKYPNNNLLSLDNINLEINKNDKIAIIGENGSGKTTLSKLIMGIYRQTSGEIYYNDKPNYNINTNSVLTNWTSVYQLYNRYKLSILDNVLISNFNNKDNINNNNNNVQALLEQTEFNLNIDNLHDGLNTLLDKEFNGIDISGGQWQKLAIARGIFRGKDFIILDEPTAAIDPIQEYKIFNIFKEMTLDKTAIIITHRLESVKFCNKIIVLKDGKIVANGSHEKLLNNNDYYRKLWQSQAMN